MKTYKTERGAMIEIKDSGELVVNAGARKKIRSVGEVVDEGKAEEKSKKQESEKQKAESGMESDPRGPVPSERKREGNCETFAADSVTTLGKRSYVVGQNENGRTLVGIKILWDDPTEMVAADLTWRDAKGKEEIDTLGLGISPSPNEVTGWTIGKQQSNPGE